MIFLYLFYGYLALGLCWGLAFVFFLVKRADHTLEHAPLALRLLLLPASIFLWPWVVAIYVLKTNRPVGTKPAH